MKFNLNLDNIKYLKISYRDTDDRTHCVKSAVKQIDEDEILACAKADQTHKMQTPQDILLSIICENGLYRTTTKLKYMDIKDIYAYFIIKNPDGLEYQQNREFFRVKMNNKVVLKFTNYSEEYTMYNISANGISIILNKNIAIPENVGIEIIFQDKIIKTKAKYIRTDNEEKILKASFNFINIDEKDRNIISQKCIQKQLEDKRNSIM